MNDISKCLRCLEDKELNQFNKNRSRPQGVQIWCIACEHAYDNTRRDKIRIRDARKYAIRDGVENTLTLDEWLDVVAEYNGHCAYCFAPYECIDHYIPRKLGGGNIKDNVRPACNRCNMSKGSKHPDEWRQYNGDLGSRA